MAFKHDKFENSEVMRSLERVAKEKGLIKADPIKKSASKNIDTSPTSNLMDNIFKLCEGLRSKGFNKYADEVEINFLNYKRAQTLYETSKETGEDLVQAAHPKGSHKLEDISGDEAVVEDILDIHLKMTDVVNKKPTGKLSTAEAINALKNIFAQNAPSTLEQKLYQSMLDDKSNNKKLAPKSVAPKNLMENMPIQDTSQTEAAINFSNQAAPILNRLKAAKELLNGPGFVQKDRDNMFPKIDSHINAIEELKNYFENKMSKPTQIISLVAYSTQLVKHNEWVDKLYTWMSK